MTIRPLPPLTIGITGGIGSGKSYLCRRISAAGFPVFYCDDEARRLMRSDIGLQGRLSRLVGCELFPEGRLCKPILRKYLCESTTHADKVNTIVHPCVAQAFTDWCDEMATRSSCLVMECALLFDSGFDRLVDLTLTVTAPMDLRIRRVMDRDGVDRDTVSRWLSLQMSDEERLRRSDLAFDNSPDASNPLTGDVDRLPESFRRAITGATGR